MLLLTMGPPPSCDLFAWWLAPPPPFWALARGELCSISEGDRAPLLERVEAPLECEDTPEGDVCPLEEAPFRWWW